MPRTGFALALASFVLAACGGASGTGPAKPGEGKKAKGVAAAALPYKILSGRGGAEIAETDFLSKVQGARAVCLGESHSNPHHHWVQLHVVDKGSSDGKALAHSA